MLQLDFRLRPTADLTPTFLACAMQSVAAAGPASWLLSALGATLAHVGGALHPVILAYSIGQDAKSNSRPLRNTTSLALRIITVIAADVLGAFTASPS